VGRRAECRYAPLPFAHARRAHLCPEACAPHGAGSLLHGWYDRPETTGCISVELRIHPKGRGTPGVRKGFDPRRHTLTAEECSEGFWVGLASYVERGGEARNFLRRKMGARGQSFQAVPKRERGRLTA
jgi:hypothetical protein